MSNVIAQTNFEASKAICFEYDDYLTSKKATVSYLRLEEDIILNQINKLSKENRQQAIDLGCGTGRVSLLINEYFEKLVSVDISEEMISIASKKYYRNPPCFIRDNFNVGINHFLDTSLKTGFICGSFGVGSCIENLEMFLADASTILNENGIMMLSFYNRNYTAITADAHDLPFSAMLHAKDNLLSVSHKSLNMQVRIHSYRYQELQEMVDKYGFTRSEFYFLPTLSGLIKSDLLHDQDFMDKIMAIDKTLLHYENTVSAPYILLVLSK